MPPRHETLSFAPSSLPPPSSNPLHPTAEMYSAMDHKLSTRRSRGEKQPVFFISVSPRRGKEKSRTKKGNLSLHIQSAFLHSENSEMYQLSANIGSDLWWISLLSLCVLKVRLSFITRVLNPLWTTDRSAEHYSPLAEFLRLYEVWINFPFSFFLLSLTSLEWKQTDA